MRGPINKRYQIIRRLSKGGMGVVYLAEDLLNDSQLVALKMLRTEGLTSSTLARFKYEFSALVQLHHPNLVGVYDFDSTKSGKFFFTMEYVPGEDLLDHIEGQRGRINENNYAWLYDIIVQICRALQYLHTRGLIHYDVKPGNIRITPEGNVKLVDFGLIGEPLENSSLIIRGTPEYIAPELVNSLTVDHRADLYSLGVSLYEIVTRRLPFSAESSLSVLRQHVEDKPTPPNEFVRGLPEGLQDLILKLLSKEPAQRFASAEDIIAAINNLVEGTKYPVETFDTRQRYIQSARLIGRDDHLRHLQGLVLRTLQGEGQIAFISGPAGIGKTRLARELKLHAQLRHVLIAEGTCQEHNHSPFHPWISILSQLLAQQRANSIKISPADAAALVKLMPELATQIGTLAKIGERPYDHNRLLETVTRFFLDYDRPLLLILDDMHFADSETIELLKNLSRRIQSSHLLLLCLFRDDELHPDHPLQELIKPPLDSYRPDFIEGDTRPRTATAWVPLTPLDEAQTKQLIGSMLGLSKTTYEPSRLTLDILTSHLMNVTGGNPLYTSDLMRCLIDKEFLYYDGQAWQVDASKLEMLPTHYQDLTLHRLENLTPGELDLLQWASILGKHIDLGLLGTLTDLPPENVYQCLSAALRGNLLVIAHHANGVQTYEFSSGLVHATIYDVLSPKERARRHQCVANILSELALENPQLLAWHFNRAGDWSEAFRWMVLAAENAHQVFATETAIHYTTQALNLLEQHPKLSTPQQTFDLLASREDDNKLLGNRHAQALDIKRMEQLADQINDAARKVEAIKRRVTLTVMLGNPHSARQAAEAGLALARQTANLKLEGDSLAALTEACYWLEDYERARESGEKALDIYRQLKNLPGEAGSLRLLGMIARRLDHHLESKTYFEKSLAINRSLFDQLGEADVLNALGVLETDFAHKRSYYEQTLQIVEAIGDRYRQARTYNNLGLLYSNLGLYRKACSYLEKAVQIQRETQARSSLVYSLESLGRVYLELDEETSAKEILQEGLALAQETGSQVNASLYWLALGRLAMSQNQLEEAQHLLQTACNLQREIGKPIYLSTSLAWLSGVYLAQANLPDACECSSEAIAILEATGTSGSFPPQEIWWIRYQVVMAMLAANKIDNGSLKSEAMYCLQRAHDAMLSAIATLSDEGLRRNYLNRVKINRDVLTEWVRRTRQLPLNHEPEISELTEADQLTASELQQTKDKFKRVLDISQRMNETRDLDLLLDFVIDQVIELSGAERGFLVLFDANGRMEFKAARGMPAQELDHLRNQVSHTILSTVTQNKKPVLLQDALADEHFGRQSSVIDLHLRSVLCVPLLAQSELVGVIYSDNRSISGRFSQADVDLLTIFASQAATAIENARLHAETLRINKALEQAAYTLEQRVNERTDELKKRTRQLQAANSALTQRAVQLRTSSQVAHQITSIMDTERLLGEVVHLIQNQFNYYYVGVWLLSESEDFIELSAATAKDIPKIEPVCISIASNNFIADVCCSGQFRMLPNLSEDIEALNITELPLSGSALALPLRMGQRTIGVLDFRSRKPTDFSADDRMVLQSLADQIAIAIRNAQLFKREQSRRQLAEALERTGREITSSLDLRTVPARILQQVATVVPYERGLILLNQGKNLVTVAQIGFPDDHRNQGLEVPIRSGDVYQQIEHSRRPVVVDDVTKEPGWSQVEWLPLNHSWIGIPLIAQDQVIGMLSLTREGIGAFSEHDAQRAASFAMQAAIALENARLYDRVSRFTEELERLVAQRTEELNKAYHNLERLDRAKSDFIDIAAHELRTPLTSIHGYSYLLLENPTAVSDPELQTLGYGILKGANHLHDIVNSMLDVAQIDSQTLEMNRDWTSVLQLIKDVVASFDTAFKERKLKLHITGLSNLPAIRADGKQLQKVFYHLLMNAIKYTPDGGSLTIRGQFFPGNNGHSEIELVFSDTGIGIAPEDQQLIFEKFYQTGRVALHSSGRTKYKGGGPGLGLAIARGIIHAHNGRIWVESKGFDEQNCPGSHFHIRLPA